MVTITENTREEVEKVLNNLGWVADFWNEKMNLISHEGKMDRKVFLDMKETGVKFLEHFVSPLAEAYEEKFLKFPAPVLKPLKSKDGDVEVNPGNSSEEGPEADGFLGEVAEGKRGRPLGSKNKKKTEPLATAEDPIPVPASLAPDPSPPVSFSGDIATGTALGLPASVVPPTTVAPSSGFRRPHTKDRKFHKSSSLSLEQRTQITNAWIKNRGVMTDLKCSDLAREMGFGGPNQVQGWVSYLTKVCNNNPDYAGRAKGWESMIVRGMIARIPVPDFFLGTVEVAFTSRPKAVV